MVILAIFMMVAFFYRLAYEYRSKVGEDERLDRSYEQLEEEHEYRECERYDGKAPAGYVADSTEDENHRYNAEDNDMACQYIGKKTYHQGGRLNEQ